MTTFLLGFFLALFALGIKALITRWRDWHIMRSQRMINRWAASHNLRIVRIEARSAFRAPLFGRTSIGQIIHHITVVDQYGLRQSGWIRCGSRWLGLYSDKITVRWD